MASPEVRWNAPPVIPAAPAEGAPAVAQRVEAVELSRTSSAAGDDAIAVEARPVGGRVELRRTPSASSPPATTTTRK